MRARLRHGLQVTAIGAVTNGVLATVKLVAGVCGHSHALIADAVESFADIFSSLVVFQGLRLAATPPDQDHPYGHGKAEPIAAAIVATALLLAAAGIALKSIEETFKPHLAPAPYTLGVLLAVVLIKESLFRFAYRKAGELDSSAVRSDAWHHRSDAITSLAAAIGISVALVGGRGYEAADDIAAVVAAGIIAWNGWRLLRPALDELMDAAPQTAAAQEVREVAGPVAGVVRIEKCLVRRMGYHYFVDMHVEVDPQISVRAGHDVAHRVKDAIRMRVPQVCDVLIHIEPAVGNFASRPGAPDSGPA